MYVLGIETSCDETAAAVVKDGSTILSNVIASSLSWHKRYGGIIPEIAFRRHTEVITQVAEAAVLKAKVKLKDLGLVAVTTTPGLLGSLMVGVSFAKAVACSQDIPILGINHLHGHIYSAAFDTGGLEFPLVALVVSGGHTNLYLVRNYHEIKILGSTLDDACGEAFDKVAKILGLGYPGGPVVERIAKNGNPRKIKFASIHTNNPFDFSFSGIKTAVLYYIQRKARKISSQQCADIAASFQENVVFLLIKKSLLACQKYKVKTLVVAGGVAANKYLRNSFRNVARPLGLSVRFPQPRLCTDNAAMIAGLGSQLFRKRYHSDLYLTIN